MQKIPCYPGEGRDRGSGRPDPLGRRAGLPRGAGGHGKWSTLAPCLSGSVRILTIMKPYCCVYLRPRCFLGRPPARVSVRKQRKLMGVGACTRMRFVSVLRDSVCLEELALLTKP